MLLSDNNIKSELSYAYLHEVAARAGIECCNAGRHSDDAGVDAMLRAVGRLRDDSVLTNFTVEIQLKATSQTPRERNNHYAFDMKVPHYEKARSTTRGQVLLVVVLFLPNDPTEWLRCTEEGLIAKRCAYWVSLLDAPASTSKPDSTQVIYLPKANVLSAESLGEVMCRVSRQERITYESP